MKTNSNKTQKDKSQSTSLVSPRKRDSKSTFHFEDNRPESVAQRKLQKTSHRSQKTNQAQQPEQPIQKKENNTGLPNHLKSGIENLSGYSMDDVTVHYNSSKPAQLQAHAYAQGSEIHLAPGQEHHLPHEAWHTIQQKQGRVKSTLQMMGKTPINNDQRLEKEADIMGAKALQMVYNEANENLTKQPTTFGVAQRAALHLQNKGEVWTVDSSQTSLLKSWIDHQQSILNLRGVMSLKQQLHHAGKLDDKEQFLYHYATLKTLEIHKLVTAKLSRVRTEANPISISNISQFVKAQSEYQNIMNGYYSKAEIMRHHKSVGLEFEFANYANDAELKDHIDLSQSNSFSALFNLPFVLETDSGKELEIGFPPFLVFIDGNEKTKIKNIWLTMRKKMSQIRASSQNENLNFLVNEIAKSGLGTGWSKVKQKYEAVKVSSERTKHYKGPEKDNVYSQLNISLSGSESAKYLKEVAERGMTTQAERELILPVHKDVSAALQSTWDEKSIEGMTEEVFIHLAKSCTSIMAIPSVIIQDSQLLKEAGMTQGLFDLQSTVKELHGIWVKDSLPNILRTIHPKSLKSASSLLEKSKAKLIAFITAEIKTRLNEAFTLGLKTTDKYFNNKIKKVSDLTQIALATANKWYSYEHWASQARLHKELGAAIIVLNKLVLKDKSGLLEPFKNDLASLRNLQIVMSNYRQDTTSALNHYNRNELRYLSSANWDQPHHNIQELTRIHTSITNFNPKIELERLFTTIVTAEIDGTIKVLKESKNFIKTPSTQYNQGEKFGSGHGVRKDTHIPTITTEKNKGQNVAEMRGDEVIDHYVNSK